MVRKDKHENRHRLNRIRLQRQSTDVIGANVRDSKSD